MEHSIRTLVHSVTDDPFKFDADVFPRVEVATRVCHDVFDQRGQQFVGMLELEWSSANLATSIQRRHVKFTGHWRGISVGGLKIETRRWRDVRRKGHGREVYWGELKIETRRQWDVKWHERGISLRQRCHSSLCTRTAQC
jgi:hypothetical protein